jgi:dihydroflavonol-4-reductase
VKALVTGAAGLIGSHIVRGVGAAGHKVRRLVRPGGRRGDVGPDIVEADVMRGGAALDEACTGIDVVFHTAAHYAYTGVSATDLRDTAVTGTETLLRACARQGVRTVVVTSSSVVFGHSHDGAIVSEGPLIGTADREPAYVAAKTEQHRRALLLADFLSLDVRFACPTVTIGPSGARLGPSNGMIVGYLADPFANTWAGGCNLVSARDVAAGHLLVAERGAPGESYLLGSDNLSWREVHRMIAELAGVPPPRSELNHAFGFLAATAEEVSAAIAGRVALTSREQAGMIGRCYWYSHAKAAGLGYAPQPARDALMETIAWLAASPHISREVRARMHLSSEIYRFRAAAMEPAR